MDFISNLVGNIIAEIIIGIVVPFLSLLGYFYREKIRKKFYNALFSALGSENSQNIELYRLRHYVKHSFVLEHSSGTIEEDNKEFSYKQFIKKVKMTKFVILTGSAGIGKSKLMQRLAFQFRSRLKKGSEGGKESILNYGIFYYKLSGKGSVDEIIDDIIKKIGSFQNSYTLFLDAFDEMRGLNTNNADEILTNLILTLNNNFSVKCNKIFISLRPEILENGYSVFNSVKLEVNDIEMVVFRLQNFSEKQILKMYRSESRKYRISQADRSREGDSDQGVAHRGGRRGAKTSDVFGNTPSKTRRENLRKLKSIIKNDPDSVFTYPLILTWANEILSKHSINDLQSISWYDALGIVIEEELERDYRCYSLSVDIAERINDPEQFVQAGREFLQDGREFLKEIALKMALSNCQRVKKSDVLSGDVAKRLEEKYGENTLIARSLLQYIEWSEDDTVDQNGGRETYYEFLHNAIYWRVLAELLLDSSTPQEIRKQIILKEVSLDPNTPRVTRVDIHLEEVSLGPNTPQRIFYGTSLITGQNKFLTPLLDYCFQGLLSIYKANNIFPSL